MLNLKPPYQSVSGTITTLSKDDGYRELTSLRHHLGPDFEAFVAHCQRLTGAYLGARATGDGDPTRLLFDEHTATAPLLGGASSSGGPHSDNWEPDADMYSAGAKQYVVLAGEPAPPPTSFEARLVAAANAAFQARHDAVRDLGHPAEKPLQVCVTAWWQWRVWWGRVGCKGNGSPLSHCPAACFAAPSVCLCCVLHCEPSFVLLFIFRSVDGGVFGAAQVPSTRMRDSLDVSMAQLNAWKASLENLEQVMADVPKEAPKQVPLLPEEAAFIEVRAHSAALLDSRDARVMRAGSVVGTPCCS